VPTVKKRRGPFAPLYRLSDRRTSARLAKIRLEREEAHERQQAFFATLPSLARVEQSDVDAYRRFLVARKMELDRQWHEECEEVWGMVTARKQIDKEIRREMESQKKMGQTRNAD
jgi:hypothetical protein